MTFWRQRHSAARTDYHQRKVEREKLDGYGWTMSLDTVRTPEEILLVKQRFERLERHIDKLQPRLGRVLRLRLGINCKPQTFEEIAQAYDVTRERIRQMEAKGVRIIKRWVWIEEKPEEYRQEQKAAAEAYAERRRLEREAELAEIQADNARERAKQAIIEESLRQPGFKPSQRRWPDGRFVRGPRTILDEIVREQRRALALEYEYLGWAEGRERKLLPASVLHEVPEPYRYRMRRVPIKRDWLNVATEGFSDGA